MKHSHWPKLVIIPSTFNLTLLIIPNFLNKFVFSLNQNLFPMLLAPKMPIRAHSTLKIYIKITPKWLLGSYSLKDWSFNVAKTSKKALLVNKSSKKRWEHSQLCNLIFLMEMWKLVLKYSRLLNQEMIIVINRLMIEIFCQNKCMEL